MKSRPSSFNLPATPHKQNYFSQLDPFKVSGIAHADLTTPYQFFVNRKEFLSFTSNGLNHPNDFGHRIYADTLNHTISPSSSTKPSTPQSINASANMI